jgi:hypothetical protein
MHADLETVNAEVLLAGSVGALAVFVLGIILGEIFALGYGAFVDRAGCKAVGSCTRDATLGLSTLKSAVRKYQRVRQSQ